MAAPGYLVFPGKAFHCDILLNIGAYFKAGRIQFLEFFRVIPPEQRKSYDGAASYAGQLLGEGRMDRLPKQKRERTAGGSSGLLEN